jgi:DUF1680 family protein
MQIDRRGLLAGSGAAALLASAPGLAAAPAARGIRPVAMDRVRLKPSVFADAQRADRAYLASLDPDRLLNRFLRAADLAARGEVYGGWEAQSISGHIMGHYLTACALLVANTGDPLIRERLAYTVAELRRAQLAGGDGYLGGTTTWDQVDRIDGKTVYEELRRGSVRATSFGLNDGWVPLYTMHKVHAGLIAAHQLAATPHALTVAIALSTYLADTFDKLDDDQVQAMLASEHGGLNESFAELHAITGDPRWLRIARRLYHRAILQPLAEGRDELAGKHANTQIPKVIGLARLHELTGEAGYAATARFFHRTVTDRHSYVIGGNSNREHFSAPGEIAAHIAETTCEACNSYNMLKLTRHLYAWDPQAAWFDGYERTQLNHILAHQRPDTGRFVYFMPLSSGARRSYSTPTDSFWCCVGSGMESHAKHSDSIYWRDDRDLYVNLFIASTLDEPDHGLRLDMDTAYPADETVRLTIAKAPRSSFGLAIRLPGWCAAPGVALNGRAATVERRDGYAVLRRRWAAGDVVTLTLPMKLRAEPTPDDPATVAFLSGPLVLAADLGAADRPFASPAPVLASGVPGAPQPAGALHRYKATALQGAALTLSPFFAQYDRRTAVYFPTFTPEKWREQGPAYQAAERARIDLAERTVDMVFLGEQQPEVDHGVTSTASERVQLNGRSGRRLRKGGSMIVRLARRAQPMLLRLGYWGEDAGQAATVSVDGVAIGTFRSDDARQAAFRFAALPLPQGTGAGPMIVTIRNASATTDLVLYELTAMVAPGEPDAGV